ncbi:uncharacterized protein LOC129613779 [Condylostylus longicornis]|uniref:uncharacterized protein LOC129613779 n=1 Tax=Condylostylus longicornis TaxID=2530218 RepID=UPI00244DEB7E|nr:uncharacterized protein LOC129613779 [Condylostylus longicornis]
MDLLQQPQKRNFNIIPYNSSQDVVLFFIAAAYAAPQYSYDPNTDEQVASAQPTGSLHTPPAIWNKQYFIHSAPDDSLDTDGLSSSQQPSRRNLRIVIVKAPENKGLENAALQLAKSASDDRTAIYVLNKQTDLAELQNKLSQLTDQNAHKPEVHFVKYKTPEEAEHAQRAIQNQYELLQGPSSVSHEGIAPVSSVIGALGRSNSNGYLPPVSFRF